MYLQNQHWDEEDKHITLKLFQPYWGAWKKFSWPEGTEGLSVSMEAIKYALKKHKKLKIVVSENKYGTYEITPTMALTKGKTFTTSNGTILLCIPCTVYKKISDPIKKLTVDDYVWNTDGTYTIKGS